MLMPGFHIPRQVGTSSRSIVRVLGCLPVMSQDLIRLRYKLMTLRIWDIGLRFDWMDGQSNQKLMLRFNETIKCMVRLLLLCAVDRSIGYTKALNLVLMYWWYCKLWGLDLLTFLENPPQVPVNFEPLSNVLSNHLNPTPFVILAHPRTGSNLLCGILHNHDKVAMYNELFHPNKLLNYFNLQSNPDFDWTPERRDANPIEFLRQLFTMDPKFAGDRRKQGAKAIGFKLFPEHWSRAPFDAILQDPRIKKIILRRESYLHVFVSMKRALFSGSFIHDSLDHISEISIHRCFKALSISTIIGTTIMSPYAETAAFYR